MNKVRMSTKKKHKSTNYKSQLKNKITKWKNTIEGINSRLNEAE